MTDRELLEAAAKAAGMPLRADDAYPFPTRVPLGWNPLTNDADAWHLAVYLYLQVEPRARTVVAWAWATVSRFSAMEHYDAHDGDRHAATRRAIVRVAALMAETA